jgi:hypothetical protein
MPTAASRGLDRVKLFPTDQEDRPGQDGSLLFLEPGTDRLDNPLLVGEFPVLELGINEVPVDGQFEAPSACWYQLQVTDLLLVSAQELARQTDGLRFVISHRTVFQFQVHKISPLSFTKSSIDHPLVS